MDSFKNKKPTTHSHAYLVAETDSWRAFTGTPIYIQTPGIPGSGENVNATAFNEGVLTFDYSRGNGSIYWLNNIDQQGNQTWPLFPGTTDNMAYIAVLPITSKFYWFVSQSADPTSAEPIPAILFDGTYGMFWWTQSTGKLFKMTAYSDNGDGTFTQIWTQIV